VDGFRVALRFLTRLPGGAHPSDAAGLAVAVPWFPVIGALVGGAVGASYVGLLAVGVPALTAAMVAMGFSALLTGGFHEDGFADSLDALGGGADPERRLEILKDSRHGTFGVLGLVVLTMVKASALATLTGSAAVAAVVAAGAMGRGGALGLMGWAPPARGEGLGASYLSAVSRQDVVIGLCVALVVGGLTLGPGVLAAAALVALGALAVAVWAQRNIGGISGDLLGAAEQVGECAVLVLVAALGPGAVWFRYV
jgi:adenosylcobinamide-GDP ribazoletransferase